MKKPERITRLTNKTGLLRIRETRGRNTDCLRGLDDRAKIFAVGGRGENEDPANLIG
jgi:hypothetical protein